MILKNKFIGEYRYNEHGKPISDNIYFNISHSKGVVVFTQNELPIGIDIELIRPTNEDLVHYISSKEEKEYIKDNIKFFADPNYEYGLYTLNNIPPSCIIDNNEVINTK